jgi:ribonuclease D
MNIHLHQDDLPANLSLGPLVAIDTETMGLDHRRDRLCLVQLSAGDGICHLVRIPRTAPGQRHAAPRLKALLEDAAVTKIFHYARFDLAALWQGIGADCRPVYCTKIAAKLTRTFTDRFGLKDLCKELIGIELSKQQQSSDWGADQFSDEQLKYAASDVLYLHRLKEKLDELLKREGRVELAAACFGFLPARAKLDLMGYEDPDIFSH